MGPFLHPNQSQEQLGATPLQDALLLLHHLEIRVNKELREHGATAHWGNQVPHSTRCVPHFPIVVELLVDKCLAGKTGVLGSREKRGRGSLSSAFSAGTRHHALPGATKAHGHLWHSSPGGFLPALSWAEHSTGAPCPTVAPSTMPRSAVLLTMAHHTQGPSHQLRLKDPSIPAPPSARTRRTHCALQHSKTRSVLLLPGGTAAPAGAHTVPCAPCAPTQPRQLHALQTGLCCGKTDTALSSMRPPESQPATTKHKS